MGISWINKKPITQVIPIVNYDQSNACFRLKNGTCMDIVKIISKDWRSKTDDEASYDVMKWARFYRVYAEDVKIVTLNFKAMTYDQQKYISGRMKVQKNPNLRRQLKRKLTEAENLEKYNTNREFYMIIYGESEEALIKNRLNVFNTLAKMVAEMDMDKKLQILYKMCNKNLNIHNINFEASETKETELDKKMLHFLSVKGGISFRDERIIKTGSGYEMCVHVYGYPPNMLRFWMSTLCNINNVITTIDIATDNITEVKKNINKSIKEQSQRSIYGSDFSEKYDAQMRAQELQKLYHEIESMGEVIKLVHIRIFVASKMISELEVSAKKIIDNLEAGNYDACIFLNESKNEWQTMFWPYHNQNGNKAYYLEGQEFKSTTLAGGLPFYFSSLDDQFGTLLGYTPCHGNVLFDMFAVSSKRTHYNSIVIGSMGSGKSSLLKQQMLDRAARGDYIRTFDISGEFRYLTETIGGKFIRLDGTNGIINPLEILPGAETENGNYAVHISKLSTFFKLSTPGISREELNSFEELVNALYMKFGFIENNSYDIICHQLTGLPADRYPTFSDLITLIDEKIGEYAKRKENKFEAQITMDAIKRMDSVRRSVHNLVQNFGSLINGPTTFDNITDTQVVVFDISTIRNMKADIFDALIFNTLSLCWGNSVKNGRIMKEKYESGMIRLEDVIHTLIIIDESHNWINTKKLAAVEQVTLFAREGRKFFTGIIMASQSIRDYVPEGSSEAGINAIKILFELSQYKFIFRQDNNVAGLIQDIFHGQLTDSEIDRIPMLERGECILSITSDQNVELQVRLTDEELELFRGGV